MPRLTFRFPSLPRLSLAVVLPLVWACGGSVGPLEAPAAAEHGTPVAPGDAVEVTPPRAPIAAEGWLVLLPQDGDGGAQPQPGERGVIQLPLEREPPPVETELDAGIWEAPDAGTAPVETEPDAGIELDSGTDGDDADAGTSIGTDAGTLTPQPTPPQRTITWAPGRAQVPHTKPAPGSYRIHLIDVGTGLALLVQGHDFTALFDGGSSDDLTGISNGASSNRLLAYLFAALGPSGPAECAPRGDTYPSPHVGSAELEIDYLFLSHAHQDHVSLLKDVLHCYRVKNVIEPGAAYGTQVYGDFVQKVAGESGTHYWTATPVPANRTAQLGTRTIPFGPDVSWSQLFEGDTVTLGGAASFRLLHAVATATSTSNANETSLVVRMDLGGTSLLLMGDAESGVRADPTAAVGGVEAHLLAHWLPELDADLMQVAHHGSKTSSRLAFIQAVSPEVAMISAGPRKYGTVVLPDPEVVQAYVSTGATLLRTDLNDAWCPEPDRIGVDDAKSGGCDNWVIEVGP